MLWFLTVFDQIVKERLEKIIQKTGFKNIIQSWLDDLEVKGPDAGKLLDNHVWLYEMKSKRPPLRLYFYHQKSTNKIIIFEIEMKTNKQQKTINKLRHSLSRFLNLFAYTLFSLNFLKILVIVCKARYFVKFPLHASIFYSPVPKL